MKEHKTNIKNALYVAFDNTNTKSSQRIFLFIEYFDEQKRRQFILPKESKHKKLFLRCLSPKYNLSYINKKCHTSISLTTLLILIPKLVSLVPIASKSSITETKLAIGTPVSSWLDCSRCIVLFPRFFKSSLIPYLF